MWLYSDTSPTEKTVPSTLSSYPVAPSTLFQVSLMLVEVLVSSAAARPVGTARFLSRPIVGRWPSFSKPFTVRVWALLDTSVLANFTYSLGVVVILVLENSSLRTASLSEVAL